VLREAYATADTVVEAFEKACSILGVETYEAECEIIKNPERKILGLFGGSAAQVRAYIKTNPAKEASDYLKSILKCMNISNFEINIEEETESGAKLVLSGDDMGFVIGHRGETLDALQYLSGLVANHVDNSYYRITIDIENYREKRKETLEKLGKRMAEKAISNGRNYSLEPMNPYERRIIHTAVQEITGAKSWSEGEESNRHVVIGPEGGETVKRRYDGKNKNFREGRRDRNKKTPELRSKLEAQKPIENKKDSGTTQLYGRIEVK
jgi:spoIIIJ-associated protein